MTTTRTYSERVADAIVRGKREITSDIRLTIVPADVASFAELHQYVDANEYGGLCDTNYDEGQEFADDVMNALDEWIKDGRPATGATTDA